MSTVVVEPGSSTHLLIGHLIGATRYLKARRREQPITSWRFAVATANATAALLYDRVHPGSQGNRLGQPLSTREYLELDGEVSDPDRQKFLAALDFSTPDAMNRGLAQILVLFTELTTVESPDGLGASTLATRRLLAFLTAELGAT